MRGQLDLLVAPLRRRGRRTRSAPCGARGGSRRRRTRSAPSSRPRRPRSARGARARSPPTSASRGTRSPRSRLGCTRPHSLSSTYWRASISCSARATAFGLTAYFAKGYSGRVPVRSCTAQAFPSGSEKNTNAPHGKRWMSDTSTPRPASSARAASMSSTTSCRPLTEPGSASVMPVADRDRARRAGRRELHEAQVLVDLVVVVGVEAGLVDVERLGAVDVGDGHRDQLELEVHERQTTGGCGQFLSATHPCPKVPREAARRGRSRALASTA